MQQSNSYLKELLVVGGPTGLGISEDISDRVLRLHLD